ncbi:MAG: VanZ family protein [Desulfuromonadales bacterium]|nr:VanZ family protein [Desulfuromonadales bacterium]
MTIMAGTKVEGKGVGKVGGLWVPLALVLVVLMFVGGAAHPSRLEQALWNLGHVPAFALWTALLLKIPALRRESLAGQLGFAFILALGGGVLVEGAQTLFGRSFDLWDLLRNLAGALLAVAIFVPSPAISPPLQRRLCRGAAGLALAAVVLPATALMADSLLARQQFPLLASFESPLELGRWSGSARISRTLGLAIEGEASLQVEFGTEPYSGLFMDDFPGDWRGFGALELSLYNPQTEPLEIHLLLFDQAHRDNGRPYADRFNAVHTVPPGWSRLRIDLETAAAAPAGRRLKLGEVASFGLFTVQRIAPARLYLDQVRLLPAATVPGAGAL